MPITYGVNLAKSWGETPQQRHRPDEGIHNPYGGIGGVLVVPTRRPIHRIGFG